MLVPSATPFYYPAGNVGCLLIHGFTGSPKEMQPLGEYLSSQGYTSLGIRLFAHATSPEDMNRARWEDWAASVEDGWHILQDAVDEIYLIGLSMGGVLALYQSSNLRVAGTVALSTPYRINPNPLLPYLKYIWWLYPSAPKGESDWQDPTQTEEHFSYEKYPTRAVYELHKLLRETRSILPDIHTPVFLMHSKNDATVTPDNMVKIYKEIGTPEADKDMVYVENSGHVLTRDIQKENVFQHIRQFIEKVSTTST